jgi:hypothetical protein
VTGGTGFAPKASLQMAQITSDWEERGHVSNLVEPGWGSKEKGDGV